MTTANEPTTTTAVPACLNLDEVVSEQTIAEIAEAIEALSAARTSASSRCKRRWSDTTSPMTCRAGVCITGAERMSALRALLTGTFEEGCIRTPSTWRSSAARRWAGDRHPYPLTSRIELGADCSGCDQPIPVGDLAMMSTDAADF